MFLWFLFLLDAYFAQLFCAGFALYEGRKLTNMIIAHIAALCCVLSGGKKSA